MKDYSINNFLWKIKEINFGKVRILSNPIKITITDEKTNIKI